jgi:hypothetical protein
MLTCGPIGFLASYLMHCTNIDSNFVTPASNLSTVWLNVQMYIVVLYQTFMAFNVANVDLEKVMSFMDDWKIYATNITFGRRTQPRYSSNCTNNVPCVQPIWGM